MAGFRHICPVVPDRVTFHPECRLHRQPRASGCRLAHGRRVLLQLSSAGCLGVAWPATHSSLFRSLHDHSSPPVPLLPSPNPADLSPPARAELLFWPPLRSTDSRALSLSFRPLRVPGMPVLCALASKPSIRHWLGGLTFAKSASSAPADEACGCSGAIAADSIRPLVYESYESKRLDVRLYTEPARCLDGVGNCNGWLYCDVNAAFGAGPIKPPIPTSCMSRFLSKTRSYIVYHLWWYGFPVSTIKLTLISESTSTFQHHAAR